MIGIMCLSSCELFTCYAPLNSFAVDNRKIDTLAVFIAGGENVSQVYPDTLLPAWREGLLSIIPPMKTYGIKPEYVLIDKFYSQYVPSDTLSVFILSKAVVDKYDWEYIRKNNMVLVRYDYNVKQIPIEYEDAVIYYPPSPMMKDVKMYPAYSTFRKE